MEEVQTQGTTQQAALYEVPSLAVAAHELKSPLALIRQLSLLLRDEAEDISLQHRDVQQLLERVTLTSERSLRLVQMLTRHARLEDGLFELEPVHVGQVCEEVAHELTPLCKATGQKLEVHIPKRSTLAVANRELLRSIAFGLCDNALTQMEASDKPVIVGVSHQAGAVRLGVRDFGTSMPADTFKRLHARLGHSAQPISQRPQSSGLGLYIAGQFAAVMQGTLGVVRHRQAGATFYVDTPTSSQLSLLTL
jgi:signal transduction histidine kinase